MSTVANETDRSPARLVGRDARVAQQLVLVLFISIFSLGALNRYGIVHRFATWLPEVLSLVALLLVVAYAAREKSLALGIGYVAVGSLIVLIAVTGIVINSVPVGTILVGIRNYLKYIPFFLLPMVFVFSSADIGRQLRLLLFLALMQLPVALYQRFVESAGLGTGDLVGGTVGTSANLSIFLVCAASVWLAFWLRMANMSRVTLVVVLLALLLPTTMNASKGTILIAPIALMAPMLLEYKGKKWASRIVMGVALLGIFFSVFTPIYHHFETANKYGFGVWDFYSDKGNVEGYLVRSTTVDSGEKGGKIGGILLAFDELSQDPGWFVFGLGFGNVSVSFFGTDYSGAYYEQYGMLGGATVAAIAWELGWGGFLVIFVLLLLILKDAIYVLRADHETGALGLGWASVMLVIIVSLFYKNMLATNVLGYLFWFYSGYVVATAYRMRQKTAKHRGKALANRENSKWAPR